MSDFGAMVIVRRSDDAKITAEDRLLINQAVRAIQTETPQHNAVGESFIFRPVDSDQNIMVILSEYWLEGVEEGIYSLSVEEILEAERPKAQRVEESLVQALGDDYQLEILCETW